VIINATFFVSEADNSLYAAANSFSEFSGGISMKLATNIHRVFIAEKVFKVRGQW